MAALEAADAAAHRGARRGGDFRDDCADWSFGTAYART